MQCLPNDPEAPIGSKNGGILHLTQGERPILRIDEDVPIQLRPIVFGLVPHSIMQKRFLSAGYIGNSIEHAQHYCRHPESFPCTTRWDPLVPSSFQCEDIGSMFHISKGDDHTNRCLLCFDLFVQDWCGSEREFVSVATDSASMKWRGFPQHCHTNMYNHIEAVAVLEPGQYVEFRVRIRGGSADGTFIDLRRRYRWNGNRAACHVYVH